MKGYIKTSMVVAALLLSATFVHAGDLKPVNGNNGGVTPAPQGSKATGIAHANEHSALHTEDGNRGKADDHLRRLRPVN